MVEKKDGEETVEEFDIIEGDDPAEGGEQKPEAKAKDEKPAEDERLRQDDDDGEEDENASNEETPEQRTERRREERRKRKERQRRAEAEARREREELKLANAELQRRLMTVERMTVTNELREADTRRVNARQRFEYAEKIIAQATAAGDGEMVAKAMRTRDEAARLYHEADGFIRQRSHDLQRFETPEPQRQQKSAADPLVAKKAKEYIERNSWIDPRGKADEDSRIAVAIDNQLTEEGFDPRTDEFWDELDARLKKRLPHRFNAEAKEEKDTGRKGPPVSSGSKQSSPGKKTFYLSPERKKALQESGDWDDPVRRNKMIAQYAKYDAERKSNATR